MTNIERLKLEIKGFEYSDTELSIYLEENGLTAIEDYDTQSNVNKKAIYITALSVLESLANQPHLLKSYKSDDITVSDFAENLQSRIDQLERKVRMMNVSEDESTNPNTFMLFQS